VTDKLKIEDKNWKDQNYDEWCKRLKKELKLDNLSNKVLHIDNDIIYDPYKDQNINEPSLRILNYPSLSIGMVFYPISEEKSNSSLLRLLSHDMRVVRMVFNQKMEWNILFKDIQMNLVTWIIQCHNDEIQESFEKYVNVNYKEDIKVIYTKVGNNIDTTVLDYRDSDSTHLEILKSIDNKVGVSEKRHIYIELSIQQNVLEVVPFLRAIRLQCEKRFPEKKIQIAAYPHIEKLSDDPNQRIIIAGSVAMICSMSGVDFLFPVYDDSQIEDESKRIMLNIQNIMELESQTHKAHDPMSGSYVIDDLTRQYLSVI
jgi:hypothetical protein